MTTYKEIFGKYVKNYSSDPSNDAEGQVWYNTTSGTFKSVVASAAWSSGSPLITARRSLAGAGTQIEALAFGGRDATAATGTQTAAISMAGSTLTKTNAELYDGTSWTTTSSLANGRTKTAGAGTQSLAIAFGGEPASNKAEEYSIGFITQKITNRHIGRLTSERNDTSRQKNAYELNDESQFVAFFGAVS